jgi:Homing endonuclease associated repeat
VLSLRTAAEVFGRSPTQYEYRRLRLSLPELDLMPDATVRRTLGRSWNECVARALLDAVSDGDFITLAEGDAFVEQELVDAVRSCAADIGVQPLTQGPFRRFGGYRAVLARNGLFGDDPHRFDLRGRLLPSAWRYTDDDYRQAIKAVERELGHPPREADYREAYERRRRRISADDAPMESVLPSVSAQKKRFGPTWRDVLAAAGLQTPPIKRTARPGTSRTEWHREQVDEILKQAWVEIGEPFSSNAYIRWRRDKITFAADANESLRLPSVATIARIFGFWTAAVTACLPERRTTQSKPGQADGSE